MNPIITVNEPIDVEVTFYQTRNHQTKVIPRAFSWHGREITITQIGLHHLTRRQGQLLHIFDVASDTDDYRLEFNASTLTWTLVSMLDGGRL